MTQKAAVNFAIKIVGNLAHDNLLWDMKCPHCKKMYSHFEHAVCPECNVQLQYLTISDGSKTMAISEGTIYPILSDAEKKRHARAVASKKNAVDMTFRFKLFGFGANATTPPEIPKLHFNMKTGAMIKLLVVNHLPLISTFVTKEGQTKVELCLHVFEEYGDKIEIVREARKRAEAGTIVTPNPTIPQNPTDQQALLLQMMQTIQAMLNQSTPQPTQPNPQPVQQTISQQTQQPEPIDTDPLTEAVSSDQDYFNPFDMDIPEED